MYSRFKDNNYAAHLSEMGSLSSFNYRVKYMLCLIDIFTKHAWVKPLRNKKSKRVLHSLIEIVNEYKRKRNELWVDQDRKFYNR